MKALPSGDSDGPAISTTEKSISSTLSKTWFAPLYVNNPAAALSLLYSQRLKSELRKSQFVFWERKDCPAHQKQYYVLMVCPITGEVFLLTDKRTSEEEVLSSRRSHSMAKSDVASRIIDCHLHRLAPGEYYRYSSKSGPIPWEPYAENESPAWESLVPTAVIDQVHRLQQEQKGPLSPSKTRMVVGSKRDYDDIEESASTPHPGTRPWAPPAPPPFARILFQFYQQVHDLSFSATKHIFTWELDGAWGGVMVCPLSGELFSSEDHPSETAARHAAAEAALEIFRERRNNPSSVASGTFVTRIGDLCPPVPELIAGQIVEWQLKAPNPVDSFEIVNSSFRSVAKPLKALENFFATHFKHPICRKTFVTFRHPTYQELWGCLWVCPWQGLTIPAAPISENSYAQDPEGVFWFTSKKDAKMGAAGYAVDFLHQYLPLYLHEQNMAQASTEDRDPDIDIIPRWTIKDPDIEIIKTLLPRAVKEDIEEQQHEARARCLLPVHVTVQTEESSPGPVPERPLAPKAHPPPKKCPCYWLARFKFEQKKIPPKNLYLWWNLTPELGWTCAFHDEDTHEFFLSTPFLGVTGVRDDLGIWWFSNQDTAKHAAAARALDCYYFRANTKTHYEQLCNAHPSSTGNFASDLESFELRPETRWIGLSRNNVTK